VSVGSIFLFLSVLLFFLAGIGAALIPNAVTWGLCALALGLLLNGVSIPAWPRRGT
jgi:hypothetical protein